MNEIDLLTRMRDNAPRRVSPRAEQLFRTVIENNHYPERRRVTLQLTGISPVWRRLVFVSVPALAAVAALLVMLPSAKPPRPGAAPLTVKLLADRAVAAALSGPAVKPGQWVYEEWITSNHFTHQKTTEERWVTADDSVQAGYIGGKLYKDYYGRNETMPPNPLLLGMWIDEPLSYSDLRSLPDEPRTLIARLGKLGTQLPGPVVGCAEDAADCNAFQMIVQLFAGYAMPPTVEAKLFTAIGDIPGVSVVTGVIGGNGQRGVAFRLRLKSGYDQLILNPVTYKPEGNPGSVSIIREAFVSGPGVRP